MNNNFDFPDGTLPWAQHLTFVHVQALYAAQALALRHKQEEEARFDARAFGRWEDDGGPVYDAAVYQPHLPPHARGSRWTFAQQGRVLFARLCSNELDLLRRIAMLLQDGDIAAARRVAADHRRLFAELY